MKILVNAYGVKPNTTVTLTTTPGDNVIAYGAKLFFRDKDGNVQERKQWTSKQLESGQATFDFDATGKERYQIDLGAKVKEKATIDTVMTFSKHPPNDNPNQLKLDASEPGDIIRFWDFSPAEGA
jgi:hypothetical protein